jgi:NADH dehydrogenase/NADH:ubiquinone oxidoreductase subunit G
MEDRERHDARRLGLLGNNICNTPFNFDSDLNEPWGSSTCTCCGKCVQVCPTGALFDKSKIGSGHPKNLDFLPYLNLMREAQ